MKKASKRVASDRLHAGWADLREGRWAAARSAFESALAEEETPEACEGSSWAAWWLDDAEGVFASRERAYGLYRKRGDAADAARMATWLASDQLEFRGAWAVARAGSCAPIGCSILRSSVTRWSSSRIRTPARRGGRSTTATSTSSWLPARAAVRDAACKLPP